jgi:hypothetical protein
MWKVVIVNGLYRLAVKRACRVIYFGGEIPMECTTEQEAQRLADSLNK